MGRIPSDATSLILHTRNSTHGSPKDNENNHPVLSPSGDIRLVHNGVIYNHEELRELLGKVGKSLPEVDSSVIPAMIEVYGIDSTDEIGGYAATAWFDRETGDTLHLARFKQAPVSFVRLWDGSLAFASTPEMLGRALNKAGVAWFGGWPTHFDSMDEGDYFQIVNGEIVNESEVEWNNDYRYGGRNWNAVTSGTATSAYGKTTHIGSAATTTGPSHGFGAASVSSSLEAVQDEELDETWPDDHQPMIAMMGSEDEPSEEFMRKAIAKLYSEDATDDDQLTHEEYERWLRTGSIYEDDEDEVEDDEDTPEDGTEATGVTYFTIGEDGDYNTYDRMKALIEDLKWNASLSTGENHLVGPDEGDLRWINHFTDIGQFIDGEEVSWLRDSGSYQNIAVLMPAFIREGVSKLRTLVGA